MKLTDAIMEMLRDRGQTPHDPQVGYDCETFYYGAPVRGTTVITWGGIQGGQWEPDDDWTDEDFEDAALALTVWCSERESEWVIDANDEED